MIARIFSMCCGIVDNGDDDFYVRAEENGGNEGNTSLPSSDNQSNDGSPLSSYDNQSIGNDGNSGFGSSRDQYEQFILDSKHHPLCRVDVQPTSICRPVVSNGDKPLLCRRGSGTVMTTYCPVKVSVKDVSTTGYCPVRRVDLSSSSYEERVGVANSCFEGKMLIRSGNDGIAELRSHYTFGEGSYVDYSSVAYDWCSSSDK
ncbi:hypothetical protein [Candidatus Ichthyocystis sparus]|uniref:hypothetical protein n=1 Tax=Candidatus Ichthyocystis sparus TaxID=1561004 RepID=UPI000B82ADD6|nr:hypothetical protein [Candidatus Ichthyocystis sparus]